MHDGEPLQGPHSGRRKREPGAGRALALTGAIAFGAALMVPRPAEPERVPLPVLDAGALAATRTAEAAAAAQAGPLPYLLRAVGEAYRRLQRAGAQGAAPARLQALRGQLWRLRDQAQATHGIDGLWRLRVVQSELFVQAVRGWQGRAEPAVELLELGGGFVETARRRAWLAGDAFAGTDDDLRALFRVHWARQLDVLSLRGLGPTANQWRQYFHFVLRRGPERLQGDALAERLEELATLAQYAPDYPLALARGVVLFRAGAVPAAAEAFRAALQPSTGGAYAARALNHLAACGLALR